MKNKDQIKLEILKLYSTFKTLEKKRTLKDEIEDFDDAELILSELQTLIENTIVRLDKILILMADK